MTTKNEELIIKKLDLLFKSQQQIFELLKVQTEWQTKTIGKLIEVLK